MKLITAFVLASCLCFVAVTAFAQEPALKGCAAKRQELVLQIQQAHSAGDTHREAGLQKALKENQSHCTDASLSRDRQKRVAKAQREVTERRTELTRAAAKGDDKKVDKRKKKLAEAEEELANAQAELNR
jgi:hypothetical protein